MSWFSHNSVDPSDLEARYSTEDGMAYLDSIFTDPTNDDIDLLDRVKDVMEQIPPREADFIDLYYFRKLKQTDIAHIFGVSQPTVCYRLVRASSRIRFLLNRPAIDKDTMVEDLTRVLADPLDVQILVLMWETTCQSEVAGLLGTTQGLVRHRFLRALEKLRLFDQMSDYVSMFEFVTNNLNILRDVQRTPSEDMIFYCIR